MRIESPQHASAPSSPPPVQIHLPTSNPHANSHLLHHLRHLPPFLPFPPPPPLNLPLPLPRPHLHPLHLTQHPRPLLNPRPPRRHNLRHHVPDVFADAPRARDTHHVARAQRRGGVGDEVRGVG